VKACGCYHTSLFDTFILLQEISGAFAFQLGHPSRKVTVMVSEVERIMCLSPWQLGEFGTHELPKTLVLGFDHKLA
jgi:hypothetical protein